MERYPTDPRIQADLRIIAHEVLAGPETDDPAEIEARTDRALSSTTGVTLHGS
jgi:hypothetical protein